MASKKDSVSAHHAQEGETGVHKDSKKEGFAKLSLATLGVVFGDIGTSPLYAIRECFHGEYGIPVTHGNIWGVISLMFWALVLIVTVKYMTFILRADNQGEGGVMAPKRFGLPENSLRSCRRSLFFATGRPQFDPNQNIESKKY